MAKDTAREDYNLLRRCRGLSVGQCARSDGRGGWTDRGHMSVQTGGYRMVDLDRVLPLLRQVRSTFDLEFLGPVCDDHLRHLSGLTTILQLKIGRGTVTDLGLRHLAGLTNLTMLDLARQAVSDAGMVHLSGLASLQELNLRSTQVGDVGLAALGGLTSLQKLNLWGCPVTDVGIAALVGLTGLTSLDLCGTRVGDDGMAAIGRLESLKYLSLDGLAVTDRGARSLGALAALESLSLRGTGVGSEGAPWLAGLKHLTWLTLSETAVTDEALRHLAGHDKLISVCLDNTAVTGAGLAHLPVGLWTLSLTGVRLREDDLAVLGRFRSLDSLHLDANVASGMQGDVLDRMSAGRRSTQNEEVAVFAGLPTCPLCRQPIRDGEPVFRTLRFLPDPEFFVYAHVPIHWACYAAWEHRPRFARQYFEEQVGWAEANKHWGIARKDDAVLVSVNPDRYIREVDVILAATGSSLRVSLDEWEEWVACGWFGSCAHESERDALGEVIATLRAELPTGEALLAAAAVAKNGAGQPSSDSEPGGVVDRITYELACEKLAARAAEKGMECPYCDYFGTEFRYERVEMVTEDGPQSELVCPACGEPFGPDEV